MAKIVGVYAVSHIPSDGLRSGDVAGFKMPADRGEFLYEDRVSCVQGKQLQKNSVRPIRKMCWPDRLLFTAIAGCILSASGVIPKALSSVAVAFLLICSLILTGIMLFSLLHPVSIKRVPAVFRFPADGARKSASNPIRQIFSTSNES
jgi:hypothetical protein